MNIEIYIESNILERYVLGDVSPQEKQEVECMSHIYPEIQSELDLLSSGIEKYLENFSKEPPTELRLAVLNSIKASKSNIKAEQATVTMTNKKNNKIYWQLATAASLTLLIGVGFLLSNSNKQQKSLITRLEKDNEYYISKLDQLSEQNDQLAFNLEVITDPNNQFIDLNGIPAKAPESSLKLCWNSKSNSSYIATINLPKPPMGMQYQLWAIVDDKPVDLGVFKIDNTKRLLKMKAVENPQAFAVTLETEGGSPVPNLEELYVIGYVSS